MARTRHDCHAVSFQACHERQALLFMSSRSQSEASAVEPLSFIGSQASRVFNTVATSWRGAIFSFTRCKMITHLSIYLPGRL